MYPNLTFNKFTSPTVGIERFNDYDEITAYQSFHLALIAIQMGKRH